MDRVDRANVSKEQENPIHGDADFASVARLFALVFRKAGKLIASILSSAQQEEKKSTATKSREKLTQKQKENQKLCPTMWDSGSSGGFLPHFLLPSFIGKFLRSSVSMIALLPPRSLAAKWFYTFLPGNFLSYNPYPHTHECSNTHAHIHICSFYK